MRGFLISSYVTVFTKSSSNLVEIGIIITPGIKVIGISKIVGYAHFLLLVFFINFTITIVVDTVESFISDSIQVIINTIGSLGIGCF